ncbi:angiopoietin-related protein 3 [Engraulis encrasicolus]|uniref:angiopoietin-related protein 3 n=1 Tax=Engraulis encrasicolus TaxID=184585 RepID=UPI002FD02B22
MKPLGMLVLLVGASCVAAAGAAVARPTPPPTPSTRVPTLPTPDAHDEGKSRFAMLDDVRLLANGLLQLGQSLREFVHKTKAQINDIFNKLNIFDRSFYQLSVVTSEIKEEEEELKKTTTFLKENNEEIRNLSLQINSKIDNILQERTQLQSKVGGLEERLQGLSQSIVPAEQIQEITALRDVIDSQERTITDLLRAVREQNEQLNYQKSKIKSLEDKLNYETFQETADKPTHSESDTLSVLQYLTDTTANSSINSTVDFPIDCNQIFNQGQRNSGVYAIKPNQSKPFNVFCEMGSDGGALVIQHREDGSVDFDQTWEKYEKGFGNLQQEFWLGLEKVYVLGMQGDYVMHIQLEDWREETRFIEYRFVLDGPATDYTLHLTHLRGNLPDAMSNHTGMKFSTKDRDNDNHDESNCARNYTGGWWFNACGDTNLNGKYLWLKSRGRTLRRKGIYWKPGKGTSYTLKSTKISLVPAVQQQ